MSNLRTALISTLWLACALFAGAAQADSGALKRKADAVIDQAIAEDRIVGAVVLVAQDGKLVYERAAGLADKESRKPMQVDTLFRLSSVSKPIATVAALALVDRKKLSLDDPVTKWLPDFKPKLADGTTPTITVRQLLTHTAGLGYKFTEKPDGPYHKAQISDGFDDVKIDLAEEMRRLGERPAAQRARKPMALFALDRRAGRGHRTRGGPAARHRRRGARDETARHERHIVLDRPRASRSAGDGLFQCAVRACAHGRSAERPARPGYSRLFTLARLRLEGAPVGRRRHDRQRARHTALARSDAQRRRAGARRSRPPLRCFATRSPGLSGQAPGTGFGFGGALVVDPAAVKTPQSAGTLNWGGVYGHTWFVDPARKITVVAFTNTTPEGLFGKFPTALRDAVYEGLSQP